MEFRAVPNRVNQSPLQEIFGENKNCFVPQAGLFCSLQNFNDFMVVDCRMLMRTPQGRATPIEIEIAIEIGKLPEIDFDHDFDFDIDTELPEFENKNALVPQALPVDTAIFRV
jgi:hypothetical protein